MRGLKTNGLQELAALKRRVIRVRGLDRISAADARWLEEKCDEIEAYIQEMTELGLGEYDDGEQDWR